MLSQTFDGDVDTNMWIDVRHSSYFSKNKEVPRSMWTGIGRDGQNLWCYHESPSESGIMRLCQDLDPPFSHVAVNFTSSQIKSDSPTDLHCILLP